MQNKKQTALLLVLPSFYIAQSNFGPFRYSALALSRFEGFFSEYDTHFYDIDARFFKEFGLFDDGFPRLRKTDCLEAIDNPHHPLAVKIRSLLDPLLPEIKVEQIVCSIPIFYVAPPQWRRRDLILKLYHFVLSEISF